MKDLWRRSWSNNNTTHPPLDYGGPHPPSARLRRVHVVAGILLLAALLIAAVPSARADYSPSSHYLYGMGPAGGYVMNQGTSMSHTDPVNAWNSWTSTSKLSVGTTGCGVVRSCAIYAWEGATIWGTSCVVPSTGSAWALAFISADSYTNLPSGCDLGTTT